MTHAWRTIPFRPTGLAGAAALALALVLGWPGAARPQAEPLPGQVQLAQAKKSGRPARGAALPFEAEFAKQRRDRSILAFNDHIAAIPGPRIRELPTINGRLGDRVTLTDGPTLYFPLGYLVSALYEFDSVRPKIPGRLPASAAELEPDPNYALVGAFDRELGPACARVVDPQLGTSTELRRRPGRSISVLIDMPGRYDGLTGQATRSYAVMIGFEERYVAVDTLTRRLLDHCRSGAKTVDLPYDGSSTSVAALRSAGIVQ